MNNTFPALTPKVILGIAAHPDDLDYGAAASLAKFANEGAAVHYLILTDGSKGSADYTAVSDDLVKLRHEEQQAGLQAIGGRSVEFLDYPDAALEITMDLKRDIVRSIRRLKPDVVVTMDPGVLYVPELGMINHPDHRAAGQAALDAVFPLARDHLSFPELFQEGYEPHKVATVLLINFDTGNYAVDVTATLDAKMAALSCHVSQLPGLAITKDRLREMAARAGATAGYMYGESFVRIDIRD